MGVPRLRWPTVAALAVVVVVVAARAVTLALNPPVLRWTVDGPQADPGAADALVWTAIMLGYLAVTVLLITKAPRNAVSWLVAMTTVGAALGGWSDAVVASGGSGFWYETGSWTANWYFPVFVAGLLLVCHVFPTGHRLDGWLGVCTPVAAGGFALSVLLLMFGEDPGDIGSQGAANPLGIPIPGPLHQGLLALAVTGWLVGLASIVPILIVRFRRSAGNERQQLKWFLYCSVLALFAWWLQAFLPGLFYLAVILPFVGIAIALLRFRLYDVDRIMSRTTAYLLVLGLLVATYTGVVALVTTVIPDAGSLAIAAATLAAAALARPVFTRIKGRLDRRFDRARYDAARTVEAFSSRLRQQVDRDEIRDDLLASVNASLAPQAIGLWVPDAR